MAKRLDSATERRLTHCIEKAASLAAIDDTKDRSELLAKCLMGDNIDTKLAKTASRAFNKRLTVLMLTKTADAHKPDKFQLADPDRVHELVGGRQTVQTKTAGFAPAVAKFKISLEKVQEMRKTASVDGPVELLYEERVTKDALERHLLGCMDKMAAEHSVMLGRLREMERDIKQRKEELSRELNKVATFDVQVLSAVYGDRFDREFSDLVDKRSIRKVAGAVDPNNELSGKVRELFDHMDKYASELTSGIEFQKQIDEFSTAAAEIGNRLDKVAASAIGTLAEIGARTGYGVGAATLSGLYNTFGEATESYRKGMTNARRMLDAAGEDYFNPANALDPKAIATEKYMDQLLALSDVMADPVIASYPTKDIMEVTDSLFSRPQMRDPSNRMLLRAEVRKLLAQNGMIGLEDVTQLNTALDNEKIEKSTTEKAVGAMSALQKKDYKPAPELERLIPEFKPVKTPEEILDKVHEANKLTAKNYAEAKARAEEAEKLRKERQAERDRQDRKERERYALQQVKEREQAAEKAERAEDERQQLLDQLPESEREMFKSMPKQVIRRRLADIRQGRDSVTEQIKLVGSQFKIPEEVRKKLTPDQLKDPVLLARLGAEAEADRKKKEDAIKLFGAQSKLTPDELKALQASGKDSNLLDVIEAGTRSAQQRLEQERQRKETEQNNKEQGAHDRYWTTYSKLPESLQRQIDAEENAGRHVTQERMDALLADHRYRQQQEGKVTDSELRAAGFDRAVWDRLSTADRDEVVTQAANRRREQQEQEKTNTKNEQQSRARRELEANLARNGIQLPPDWTQMTMDQKITKGSELLNEKARKDAQKQQDREKAAQSKTDEEIENRKRRSEAARLSAEEAARIYDFYNGGPGAHDGKSREEINAEVADLYKAIGVVRRLYDMKPTRGTNGNNNVMEYTEQGKTKSDRVPVTKDELIARVKAALTMMKTYEGAVAGQPGGKDGKEGKGKGRR